MLENVQWQVRVWWWEVIAYQWECWFTQGARRRLNKRYKVGTVLWGHGRKNYSLYLKWKLEPLVDMTDGPSFPLLYCFGSPNNHHRSCNRPVFETGKLFGLTMCVCVCVCVCESCPLLDRREVTAVFFTRSLLASPHSSYCNKGCVTLWPYHLHEKSILRPKKFMETQIFHAAKT